MNSLMRNFLHSFCLVSISLMFVQCTTDDDGGSALRGSAKFEITDAPIDDTNVQGAFVTVTAVKVDGEVISSFEGRQTIDLLAYQNGNTEVLGVGELDAGAYSNLTLELDYDVDAEGNSPGCYVLTTENEKRSLNNNNTNDLQLASNFTVAADQTTNVVLDFDVRKAIKSTSTSSYSFVTNNELRSSIRVVTKNRTGRVRGEVQNANQYGDRVVVFAYAKGEFNSDTETQGQGESNVTFAKAVTSATVDANGNYTVAFLEEGDYELHFFAYDDEDNDGDRELMGELQLSLLGSLGLDLNTISVNAEANVEINVNATGLLP